MFSGLDRVSQLEEDVGFYRRLRARAARAAGADRALPRLPPAHSWRSSGWECRSTPASSWSTRGASSGPTSTAATPATCPDARATRSPSWRRSARRLAALPAAMRDYGPPRRSARRLRRGCYVRRPSGCDGVARCADPQLRRYLAEHGEVVWQRRRGSSCTSSDRRCRRTASGAARAGAPGRGEDAGARPRARRRLPGRPRARRPAARPRDHASSAGSWGASDPSSPSSSRWTGRSIWRAPVQRRAPRCRRGVPGPGGGRARLRDDRQRSGTSPMGRCRRSSLFSRMASRVAVRPAARLRGETAAGRVRHRDGAAGCTEARRCAARRRR